MTTRNLFTAFTSAQTLAADVPVIPAQPNPGPADDATLLAALRNAATDRDQIIQRRLGLMAATELQS
ncbi:MAG TPA: hypothetical protein VF523_18400 [Burkholderiales bacterium]